MLFFFLFFETRQQFYCSIAKIEKLVDTMVFQLYLVLDVRADFVELIRLIQIAVCIGRRK